MSTYRYPKKICRPPSHPGQTDDEAYDEIHRKMEELLIKYSRIIKYSRNINSFQAPGISEKEMQKQAGIGSRNTLRKHFHGNEKELQKQASISKKRGKRRYGFAELGLVEKRKGKWLWIVHARRVEAIQKIFRCSLAALEEGTKNKSAEEIESLLNKQILIFRPRTSSDKLKYDLLTLNENMNPLEKNFAESVFEKLRANYQAFDSFVKEQMERTGCTREQVVKQYKNARME